MKLMKLLYLLTLILSISVLFFGYAAFAAPLEEPTTILVQDVSTGDVSQPPAHNAPQSADEIEPVPSLPDDWEQPRPFGAGPDSPTPGAGHSEESILTELAGPVIKEIEVSGNQEVVTQHILSVLSSKVGEPVDEEKLRQDAEAIYELGFFVAADYRVSDMDDGVKVTFLVQENPVVGEITFTGNTVYSSQALQDLIFTKPGMIFNRTFFRNDLQRIKEKYQEDGYVMANVADVQIQGDVINVVIVEPKVAQIVIQGNKITKTHVIRRYIKLKEGEQFNSNKLRLSLNRLQGIGFFNDVNVNFEPADNPDDVILVLTVEEGRTGRLGFNVSYGTQSGFGGGLSYENTNIGGNGHRLSTGFDLGDREQYWITYEQPYMSGHVMAWKIGAYKQAWSDLNYYYGGTKQFEYDRDKTGAYVGFGKKFHDDSIYNWYITLDWHKVNNDAKSDIDSLSLSPGSIQYIKDDLGDGDYYSATTSFRRYNVDEYLPYTKGDVESINVQFGNADVHGTTYNFIKYWLDTRLYIPVDKLLKDFFETSFGAVQDKPVMLASRIIVGSATGDVPYEELYTVGGDTTLRGYKDEQYRGEKMLLGNFELRIPLDKAFGIVFLYDIGRAWRENSSDGHTSFGSDLQYSYGFGVRLNTPLGNIRLDYAKGRDDDRFHFGFGELF